MVGFVHSTFKKFLMALLLFIATLLVPAKVLAENSASHPSTVEVFECVSKDVWDAGYVLRFGAADCREHETTIPSDLYEITRIWTPERFFNGDLKLLRIDDSTDHLLLVDRVPDPLIAIEFYVNTPDPQIEVLVANGTKPKQFGTLRCSPRLLTMLSKACL